LTFTNGFDDVDDDLFAVAELHPCIIGGEQRIGNPEIAEGIVCYNRDAVRSNDLYDSTDVYSTRPQIEARLLPSRRIGETTTQRKLRHPEELHFVTAGSIVSVVPSLAEFILKNARFLV